MSQGFKSLLWKNLGTQLTPTVYLLDWGWGWKEAEDGLLL